jgi:(1->4)-alpha-D-glucan 1-alpha-D-glucosylmutase
LPSALSGRPAELLDSLPDGRLKMLVTQRALALRAEHPALFEHGGYVALTVAGAHAERVVAFARRRRGAWAITIAPRMVAGLCRDGRPPLPDAWRGLRILLPSRAPARWRQALTGDRLETEHDSRGASISVARAFTDIPLALLASDD